MRLPGGLRSTSCANFPPLISTCQALSAYHISLISCPPLVSYYYMYHDTLYICNINGKFTPKAKVCGQALAQGTEFMPRDTRLPRKESKLCITEGNLNGKRQQWGKFSLGMFRRPRHGCLISTWPVLCAQSTCNLPDHGTRALTQQCNARWVRGPYNSDSIRTCGATNGPTQFIIGRHTQCWITG